MLVGDGTGADLCWHINVHTGLSLSSGTTIPEDTEKALTGLV